MPPNEHFDQCGDTTLVRLPSLRVAAGLRCTPMSILGELACRPGGLACIFGALTCLAGAPTYDLGERTCILGARACTLVNLHVF